MSGFDPTINEAENFCRNPDGDLSGPWCYVDDDGDDDGDDNSDGKGGKWESCGIEWCDSNDDADGFR